MRVRVSRAGREDRVVQLGCLQQFFWIARAPRGVTIRAREERPGVHPKSIHHHVEKRRDGLIGAGSGCDLLEDQGFNRS